MKLKYIFVTVVNAMKGIKMFCDFDDVDLGIIAIAIICIITAVLFAIFSVENLKEMSTILASGITAIATLAGRRSKIAREDTSVDNTQQS
jgi:hypothetical protein